MRPRDEAELAEILIAMPGPFEPVCGGSKRSIGPGGRAEPLELAAICGVVDYEPRELVLTARAGTPLKEIESLLAQHGQCLAFEPPAPEMLLGSCGAPSLGGVLATNSSGPRRVASGAARDHFLGFRAVSGRGERFRGGGRVVKNVTGYDLPKLLAGSWGTLAVLTEVTVRVHPAPEHECTLLLASDLAVAMQRLTAALRSPCQVSGAAYDPQQGVMLRLEGFAASVCERASALLGLLGNPPHERLEQESSRCAWRQVGAAATVATCPVVWRISFPPAEATRLVTLLAPERYLLDWGGGLAYLGYSQLEPARVRGALDTGHALLVKAPDRSGVAVFQPLSGPLAAVAMRLKEAFDPDDKLNPGWLVA